MSKARNEYYSDEGIFIPVRARNYVNELEQQNSELIEFVKEMNEIGKVNPMRLCEYSDVIYHHSLNLLSKHTTEV